MARDIKINGIYKHFKGDYYLVVDIAKSSETKEKYPNASQKYRFELQDIESVASNFKK